MQVVCRLSGLRRTHGCAVGVISTCQTLGACVAVLYLQILTLAALSGGLLQDFLRGGLLSDT